MMKKHEKKERKDFMDMFITFLHRVWHILKAFCLFSEHILIGVLLRKIVNWYDKKNGQFVSRKEVKRLKEENNILMQSLNQIHSSHQTDWGELKGQVDTANKTIKRLESILNKISADFKELK